MNPTMLAQMDQPLPQEEPQEDPQLTPLDSEEDEQAEACESCRFWEPKTQEGIGICHLISGAKKPPQVTAKGMLLTPADFYCSAFQPAEQPDTMGEPSEEEISKMLEEMSQRQGPVQ